MNDKEEQQALYWEKAILGKQIDEFLSSEIGKFLLNKAHDEWVTAIEALRDCSPEDLLKHQSNMKRAESIRAWLIGAVEEGLRALNLIEEDEE